MSDRTQADPLRRRLFMGLGVLCAFGVFVWACVVLFGPGFSDGGAAGSDAEGAEAVVVPDPTPKPGELWVVVSKSKRRLVVLRGEETIRSYPIVLGSDPDGDKQREGDGRTPIGTFYVSEKNEKSKYYLFIGVSYPNEEDAERGLRDGLITDEEYETIVHAIEERRCPPWYTRLGGEIGFHGGGTGWDWTRGCVALDNKDMRELYALIREGVNVTIQP